MALTRPRYSNIVDTDYKASCRVVTTTNITLSGGAPNVYDSVNLAAGDRILVAGQSTASQNGIYIVQTVGTGGNGTWIRSFDANTSDRVTPGLTTNIEDGTYVGKAWRLTTGNPIILGTTSLTFVDTAASIGGVAGSNRNIQYNSLGTQAGASDFNYYSETGNVIATGNVILGNSTVSNVVINSTTESTSSTTGALVVKGGAGIVGNLYVTGDIFASNLQSIASHTINVQDPLLYLTANTAYPYVYDIGFFSHFVGGTSNVYQHTGLVRDYTANQWKLFSNVSTEPGSTIDWSDPDIKYDTLRIGSLTLDSNILPDSGNLRVQGHIVPDANVTYNLGSSNLRWKDLWLSGNTIYLGPESMSVDESGQWAFTSGGSTVSLGSNTEFNPPKANIAGNAIVGSLYTGSGIFWSANNEPFTGIKFTSSSTAPTSPRLGDYWYDTDTDILFSRINDGVSSIWVDVGSAAANVASVLVANTVIVNQSLTAGNLAINSNAAITRGLTANTLTSTRLLTVNSDGQPIAIANGASDGVGNIGATASAFNTVFAKATSAQYADLAEKYISDSEYAPGTVVIFGGTKEITVSTVEHDSRVAGVISTNPAYIMNSTVDGLPVALTGKVPCRVIGPVNKGDLLVSSSIIGSAERLNILKYTPGCVIGKSLEEIKGNELKTIEVVVGRF
jgi:hypothetical protein